MTKVARSLQYLYCSKSSPLYNRLQNAVQPSTFAHYIPEEGKNGPKARSTYQFILKKIKRKDIPHISQYNFGFQKFVEQMDSIKDEIAETE